MNTSKIMDFIAEGWKEIMLGNEIKEKKLANAEIEGYVETDNKYQNLSLEDDIYSHEK